MDFNAILVIIAILSMFWAMMRVLLTAFTTLNERRDAIATGYLNGRPITSRHRKTLFYHDWLPLTGAAVFFMLIVGIIIFELPTLLLLEADSVLLERMKTLSLLAAVMPFIMAIGYVVTSFADIIYIGTLLTENKRSTEPDT